MTKTFKNEPFFLNFEFWSLGFDIWIFNPLKNFQQSKSPPGITKAWSSGPGYLLLIAVKFSLKWAVRRNADVIGLLVRKLG